MRKVGRDEFRHGRIDPEQIDGKRKREVSALIDLDCGLLNNCPLGIDSIWVSDWW